MSASDTQAISGDYDAMIGSLDLETKVCC